MKVAFREFKSVPRPAFHERPAGPTVSPFMGRILVVTGVVLIALGLLWPWLSRLGLGRLPGDIRIETEGGGFYFPIVTCLIVSIVLSLVFWFFRR
jgi:DUF2905 family protein